MLSRVLQAAGALEVKKPDHPFEHLQTFYCSYKNFPNKDSSTSGHVVGLMVYGTTGSRPVSIEPIPDFAITQEQFLSSGERGTFFTGRPAPKKSNFIQVPFQLALHPTLGMKQVSLSFLLTDFVSNVLLYRIHL